MCERRVNLLVYSFSFKKLFLDVAYSFHRHSYIGFILVFDSSIHNKQKSKRFESVMGECGGLCCLV